MEKMWYNMLMERLRRKIDEYLINWKNSNEKLPLIVKGARQIGKTNAIRFFGKNNYEVFIEINFAFLWWDASSLIPIEVKANDNVTTSLNHLIDSDTYSDIKYGIKLCNKNVGYNGKFYTFPYFLTFLLKKFLKR